jgi:phenylacetic acid degradation operon negative regulatory protein
MFHDIRTAHKQGQTSKSVYDTLYRLTASGLVKQTSQGFLLTLEGHKLIHSQKPQRDGVWKIIIFDIPESKRFVRTFLRAKLVGLGFKKWQHSIWVSPYRLHPELEQELLDLAEKYFVRLIKTSNINWTRDLDKLFPVD